MAVTSVYVGKRTWQEVRVGEERLERSRQALAKTAAFERATAENLTGGPDAFASRSVEEAFAETLSALMRARATFRVVIDQAGTEKVARTGDNLAAVKDLGEPVPMTGERVRHITLRVKGSYQDYGLFQGFVESLRTLPVAVLELRAASNTYELRLRIFGAPGSSS